jgi:hypothetical protein
VEEGYTQPQQATDGRQTTAVERLKVMIAAVDRATTTTSIAQAQSVLTGAVQVLHLPHELMQLLTLRDRLLDTEMQGRIQLLTLVLETDKNLSFDKTYCSYRFLLCSKVLYNYLRQTWAALGV